jgi:hypothetical protein
MKNEETKTGAAGDKWRVACDKKWTARRIACHPSPVTCHLARSRVNFFFILHSSFFIF